MEPVQYNWLDASVKAAGAWRSVPMPPERTERDIQLWWLVAGAVVYWLALFLFAWNVLAATPLFVLLGLGTVLILAGQFFHHRRRRS